jgi:nicotinate phosphoribosyltransferase
MAGDVLTLHDDRQEGEPLLHPVLRGGKRLDGPMPLSASRARAAGQLGCLPERLRTLDRARQPFKVKISGALQSLVLAVDEQSR